MSLLMLLRGASAASTSALRVKPQAGGAPFAAGDLVRLKDGTHDAWLRVNDAGSDQGAYYEYAVSLLSGSSGATFAAGEAVVDYGQAGDGRLLLTADQTNAPYISIATHDNASVPAWTEHVRLGRLDGIAGLTGWGLWSDNVYLTGSIEARDLLIGDRGGAYIRGGKVQDLDASGNPLDPDHIQHGIRIYDATGLPKVSLVTGTLHSPNTPAVMLGAEGDANYFWYTEGELRLKGRAVIDGGQLGGFLVNDRRITSTNNKVILVNADDADYTEGLLLVTGAAADAGALAWRKSVASGHEDNWAGILTTVHNTAASGGFAQGTTMLLGASNLFDTTDPNTALRLEASTPMSGGEKAYLELGKTGNSYGFGEAMWLETNAVVKALNGIQTESISPEATGGRLALYGLSGRSWVGPGDFAYVTQTGTAGRLTTTGSGIQCVPSALDMWFKLDIPARLAVAPVNTLRQLTIYYKTTVSAAHIASVQIVKQNMTTDDVTVVAGYGVTLGEGTTGFGSQTLLESDMAIDDTRPHLIRVTLGGVTDYGHVTLYGFLAEWSSNV